MTNLISRAAEPEPSLEKLLAGVARGEQQLFEPFYDQIAHKIFGLVRTVLRDASQAEEVSQDVLLELWQRAPTYSHERGTVTAWAMTVAHRRAVDRVRSEEASGRRERRATFETCRTKPFDQVAETVLDGDERTRVRHCLGRLTQRQLEAVLLAYYDGRTCQDIADEHGVPASTVKSRLRAAMHRLRECMQPAN